MSAPLVSVLLPTRGRPQLLRESIGSLLETCTDPDSFEVLYAFDRDDEAGLEAYDHIVWDLPGTHRPLIFQERHGYTGLHVYVNALAGHPPAPIGWAGPNGRWLLLWNDDAVMQTYGWNAEIAKWPDRYVLDLWSNHEPETCAFPCVPRWWVDRLGHFSLNAHNDTWWQEIGERTRRLVRVEVDVLHRRFDLDDGVAAADDATYAESLAQRQPRVFYSEENLGLIARDATVVQNLMIAQYEARWRGEADWANEGRVDRAR